MFLAPAAFSDTRTQQSTTMDELRRRRRARVIGLTTIAAAAVGTGILIAGNLGGLTSAPATGGRGGDPSIASMAEAYLASPEYRALKEMILSLRVQG